MPLAYDGRNWYGLEWLISAIRPEPIDPSQPAELIVTMLRGDPLPLRGPQAEALMQQLLAATNPAPVQGPVAPGAAPVADEPLLARRVTLSQQQPAESSILGSPQDQ